MEEWVNRTFRGTDECQSARIRFTPVNCSQILLPIEILQMFKYLIGFLGDSRKEFVIGVLVQQRGNFYEKKNE